MESTARREIRVDRDLCMGSAQCCWYAPNTFGQDDDAVAIVTDQHGDPEDAIATAIEGCPTQALSIVTIQGETETADQELGARTAAQGHIWHPSTCLSFLEICERFWKGCLWNGRFLLTQDGYGG
jgi:ferredoxin